MPNALRAQRRLRAREALRPDAGVIGRQLGAHVLWIELLRACRRPDKVAEHDGDDLAFLDRPGSRGEARSALRAELRLWRILRTASRACDHRRSVRPDGSGA